MNIIQKIYSWHVRCQNFYSQIQMQGGQIYTCLEGNLATIKDGEIQHISRGLLV